jgi:hypothetical protein
MLRNCHGWEFFGLVRLFSDPVLNFWLDSVSFGSVYRRKETVGRRSRRLAEQFLESLDLSVFLTYLIDEMLSFPIKNTILLKPHCGYQKRKYFYYVRWSASFLAARNEALASAVEAP